MYRVYFVHMRHNVRWNRILSIFQLDKLNDWWENEIDISRIEKLK